MSSDEAPISSPEQFLSKEDRIQAAIAEIWAQESLPKENQLSHTRICTNLDVNRTTVKNRMNGMHPIAKSNADKAHFSEAKSQILTQLIIHMAQRGFPLTKRRLEDLANTLLLAKHCSMALLDDILDDGFFTADPNLVASAPIVGPTWSERWLKKYQEDVKKYKTDTMDSVWANALNLESVDHWFGLVQKSYEEHKFKLENIWGMDETCRWNSTSQQETVIGPKGVKLQYITLPLNCDSNTLIVSTSAAGQVLHRYCIFSGKKEQSAWRAHNPLQCE